MYTVVFAYIVGIVSAGLVVYLCFECWSTCSYKVLSAHLKWKVHHLCMYLYETAYHSSSVAVDEVIFAAIIFLFFTWQYAGTVCGPSATDNSNNQTCCKSNLVTLAPVTLHSPCLIMLMKTYTCCWVGEIMLELYCITSWRPRTYLLSSKIYQKMSNVFIFLCFLLWCYIAYRNSRVFCLIVYNTVNVGLCWQSP